MSRVRIEGTVAPGYDSVKKMFTDNVTRGVEENAQLCVYVKGEKVVDLWGTSVGNDKYNAETLQNVFSSGKNLAAFAMACMVDKGLLSYDAPVCQYWPEFAKNGKDKLLVKDVLRHEGGFPWIDKLFTFKDFSRESIKANVVGKALEEDELHYPPSAYNTKREYHAMSRGWVLNEIFRRVEPSGRTMGEYLREEVCGPLGIKTYVGVLPEDLDNFVDLATWDKKYILLQCTLPRFLGSKSEIGLTDFAGMAYKMLTTKKKPLTPEELAAKDTRKKRPKVQIKELSDTGLQGLTAGFNNPDCRMGESSSAGSSCTARGLAKLAACIEAGGEIDGVRIIGKEGVKAMQEEWKVARDYAMGGLKTNFSQGGVNKFETYPEDPARSVAHKNYRKGWIGWMGLGGSVMQWEPELNIGFGFTCSLLHFYDLGNLRTAKYQHEVAMCVKNLNEQAKL